MGLIEWETLSPEQKFGLATVALAIATAVFRGVGYLFDVLLARRKMKYEGRELYRAEQLKVMESFFELIPRLVEPADEETFDKYWWELTYLYYGSAHILSGKKLHEALNAFAETYWKYPDYTDWDKAHSTASGNSNKKYGELETAAKKLSLEINNYMRAEFSDGKTEELKFKPVGRRKK